MSSKEKSAIISIVGTLAIIAIYCLILFQKYQELALTPANDFKFWGIIFLILIPVLVVTQTIIYIVFTIINTIATKEKPTTFNDEMDKLIDLKSYRNNLIFLVVGVFASMSLLVFGFLPRATFISLGCTVIIAGLIGDVTKLCLYRRGY